MIGMVVRYLPVSSNKCDISFYVCIVLFVVIMFFQVTLCYVSLSVRDYFGWWYKSCVPILYRGEIYI